MYNSGFGVVSGIFGGLSIAFSIIGMIVAIAIAVFVVGTVGKVYELTSPGEKRSGMKLLAFFLPGLAYYFSEKELSEYCERNGIAHSDKSIIYIIIGFLVVGGNLIAAALTFSDLKKIKSSI